MYLSGPERHGVRPHAPEHDLEPLSHRRREPASPTGAARYLARRAEHDLEPPLVETTLSRDAQPPPERQASTSVNGRDTWFDSVPHWPLTSPSACCTVKPTRVAASPSAATCSPVFILPPPLPAVRMG